MVFLFYEGTFKKKCLVLASFSIAFLLFDLIVEAVLHPFSNHIEHHGIEGPILTKASLLVTIKSLNALIKGRSKSLPAAYIWIILLMTAIELYLLTLTSIRDFRLATMSYHMLASFLLLDLILLYLLNRLQESYQLKASNIALSYQLHAYHENQLQYENYLKEIRRFRHDFKNHLITLKELGLRESASQIVDYIEQLDIYQSESDGGVVAATGNIAIDSLLNTKYIQMLHYEIELKLNLEVPKQLPFQEVDLTIIIGNLLDNAIEGALKVTDRPRVIDAAIRFQKGNLLIKIDNSYAPKALRKANGFLATTKANRSEHGLGMKIIQRTSAKYSGFFEYETDGETFKTKVLLYP